MQRLARRVEAKGPRRVDAPDKTRPVSCSSGRSRQLAPDPVLARAASALKASLALGKLYQSTDRLAEADAVLAAALEGFLLRPRCLRSPRRRRWSSVWRSPLRTVKATSCSQWKSNGGFGANSGPSWGDRCRRAFRPKPKFLRRWPLRSAEVGEIIRRRRAALLRNRHVRGHDASQPCLGLRSPPSMTSETGKVRSKVVAINKSGSIVAWKMIVEAASA